MIHGAVPNSLSSSQPIMAAASGIPIRFCATIRPAERITVGRIGRLALGFHLLGPLQSLFERRQPGIRGRVRILPGLVFRHGPLTPNVRSDARKAAARKARNMAADEPAKARPLYEGAWH